MKYLTILSLYLIALTGWSQNSIYSVQVDLNDVQDDKIKISITVPPVTENTIEYHMPKIVPGTYSISDFGRFVRDFEAFDGNGDPLRSEKVSTNRWEISDASSLSMVTYWIEDTFDPTEGYTENIIFEPGGTSIEKDRDVFVLNTFGLVGYLDGYKMVPYELNVSYPKHLYGATALERKESAPGKDTFVASNYHFLADGPIMYSKADTITKTIAGSEVIISVYSPNKKLSAREVMDNVDDLMEAQTNYLGGKLPVNRYAYLIYLLDYQSLSNAMGALEHSYSSLYTLPEARAELLAQTIRDVAAHEFLHIVTPLNIHSEQIHNFNYIEPEMSKHLWLYEGVTEYSAMHVQVRNNLYDGETFLSEIRQKLQVADQFPDVSFTEMSAKILEPDYEPMYQNVYYKGALIGLCLDLYLLKYTDGKMDLPRLLQELSKTYGPMKAFNDDELFDVIEGLTTPEIKEFLEIYVAGSEPLPVEQCLRWVGVNYLPMEEISATTLGNIQLAIGEEDRIAIASLADANDFGQSIGYKEGDTFLQINGKDLTLTNYETFLDEIKYEYVEGEKMKITVLREVNGKEKKVKLKGKVTKITTFDRHKIEFDPNPTEGVSQLRSLWLNGLQ